VQEEQAAPPRGDQQAQALQEAPEAPLISANLDAMSRLRKGGGALAVTAFVIALFAQPAGAVVAPKADYRFHDSLSSSVPGAPALTDLGSGNGYASENVGGCMTRVHTFPKGNGLVLDASGFRPGPSFSQTVVIDFRLSDVSGYRRLIQTTDGTSDTGLYIRDGNLVWYESGPHSTPTITVAPNQFVEVTLIQNAILSMFSMSGFVNGAQQVSFTSAVELGPQIRLFKDNDPPDASDEDSSGAVFRVRYYPGGFIPADAQTVYADSLLGNPSSCPGADASATRKPRALKSSYGGIVVETGVLATCPDAGVVCSGTASVTGPGAKSSKKASKLASAAINVPPGIAQPVTVVLGKRGQKLLLRRGKLKVTASVSVAGPNGKPATALTHGKIMQPGAHRSHR
jgi:hypothetical protein